MKSKKLSIAIVSTFIAALGLAACSNVTAKDNNILTLSGYDVSIDADKIYNEYKTSNDGISSFYDAILEVMIRNFFKTSEDTEVKNKLAEFEEQAKSDVKGDKETASENAKTNPDSNYDAEWEKILKSKNCENEKDLELKYLYEYEKKEYQDRYFKNHRDELTEQYTGTQVNEKHASMYPYHVRHILVKTTASATDYVTGEITEEEARKLAAVYSELASGKDFGDVAVRLSEDEGSAAKFGDSGIMTTATSFVNEFKLGLYAYDTIYGKGVTGDADKKEGVFADNTTKARLESIGLGEVPFEVFEFLDDKADITKNEKNLQVNEGQAKYFPRNVMWNNYLNLHNVFVITDEHITNTVDHEDAQYGEHPFNNHKIENDFGELYKSPLDAAKNKSGFRKVPQISNEHRVLTDEQGRVIIGVRSEFGIHLMVMHRTPFEVGTITGYSTADGYTYDDVNINEYYTTFKPGDTKYPAKAEGSTKDKITYVNFLNAEKSTLTARAKEVEDQIKGFDPMYDYRIFEELQETSGVTINGDDIKASIEDFIKNKREYNKWNDQKNLNEAWKAYLNLIDLQMETRDDKDGLDESKRLVRVTGAIHFQESTNDIWKEGGCCYYEK